MRAPLSRFCFFVQVIGDAEAEVELECMRTPLQHIAQEISNNIAGKHQRSLQFGMRFGDLRDSGTVLGESCTTVRKRCYKGVHLPSDVGSHFRPRRRKGRLRKMS